MSSIFLRHIHSILAKRLEARLTLYKRLSAFIKADGCADKATPIDLILRQQHQTHTSAYIASLDVSKAFDSVSHVAMFDTLKSYEFSNNTY